MVAANGVELCVQTFGDPAAPALLLIGGAASAMDWWEDELCARLARGPRHVIRYDLRDTGQSTSYEAGAPGYGGPDLLADIPALLDALGIAGAHLAGISMGGAMAQQVALGQPERVRTLTLLSTTPAGSETLDLPPASAALQATFTDPGPTPDWTDRAAVIDYIVMQQGPYQGSVTPDEADLRALVATIVDRTRDMAASLTNHWIIDAAEATRALGDLRTPTLVLHGTEDPLFPYPHGEALARLIPGAHLVPLHGVGHEFPPRAVWDEVVAAILDHTR